MSNIEHLITCEGIVGLEAGGTPPTQIQWFDINYNDASTSKNAWVRWMQNYNTTLGQFTSSINIWTNNFSLVKGFITFYYTKTE